MMVKRYNLIVQHNPVITDGPGTVNVGVEEADSGEWVRYEDYAKLERIVEMRNEEIDILRNGDDSYVAYIKRINEHKCRCETKKIGDAGNVTELHEARCKTCSNLSIAAEGLAYCQLGHWEGAILPNMGKDCDDWEKEDG
jgi:hypothetical protein